MSTKLAADATTNQQQ